MILAIDPGPQQSGYVLYDDGHVVDSGVWANQQMLFKVQYYSDNPRCTCAIEMIASYGMAVGAEVFETCVWIGRFVQAWQGLDHNNLLPRLVYRKDVKMHLCGTTKAKDGNIRQRLIDMLGAPGTKRSPGPTYGLNSHMWPALAVAVTAAQTKEAAA